MQALIDHLKSNSIDIVLSGDDLEISFDDDKLTDDLLDQLRSNKENIVSYLKEQEEQTVLDGKIPAAKKAASYPLTPSQRRAWILSQIEGYNYAYNMHETLVFEGNLDPDALEQSLLDLIERHEILRTVIQEDESETARQFVRKIEDTKFKLEHKDLRGQNVSDDDIIPVIMEEIKIIFDLYNGPLTKCVLYQVEDKKWYFLFVIHHVISDSRSTDVIKRDLLLLYNARAQGLKNPLPPLRVQYKDFAVWKDKLLSPEYLKPQKEYWLKQFEGELPILELPTDKPRPVERLVSAGILRRSIEKPLVEKFKSFCSKQGSTLFTGLMSLINLVFYKYSHQKDIVVGFPIYGREFPELYDQVGFFADTLALRTRFEETDSFRTLLKNVNTKAYEAYENKDYPFEEMVNELKVKRDTSRTIFFDVFVILQNFEGTKPEEIGFYDVDVKGVEGFETRFGAFDLTFNIFETPTELFYTFEFNESIYNKKSIERIAVHLERLMSLVLEQPDIAVKDIDIQTTAEKAKLFEFSNLKLNVTNKQLLFDNESKNLSEEIAVIFKDTSLSFKEIEEQTNQFANFLKINHQIKRNDIIALDLSNDKHFLIALLGSLKSDGICFPLNANISASKNQKLIADNTCKTVITQEEFDKFLSTQNKYGTSYSISAVNANEPTLLVYKKDESNELERLSLTHINCWMLIRKMQYAFNQELTAIKAFSTFNFLNSILEIIWGVKSEKKLLFPGATIDKLLPNKTLDFSFFYFGNEGTEKNRYEMLIEGAKYADKNGFTAIWTPERHFNQFGGPFPNPSVLGAALAAITDNLSIRSGSVVPNLHNPIRIAEEWSVVDNLSGGRAGICCASGWNVNDFVFAPENYEDRHRLLFENIEKIRKLWSGGTLALVNGINETKEIGILPKPIQKELPMWIAASTSIETFKSAGKIGAGILTGLLNHDLEGLREKITAYRQAYREAGHDPKQERVVLMLHTYLDEDMEKVHELARPPMTDYILKSVQMAKKQASKDELTDVIKGVTDDEMKELLNYTVNNYFTEKSLVGTKTTCLKMLKRVLENDVDEIACLIDFGIEFKHIVKSFSRLTDLKDTFKAQVNEKTATNIKFINDVFDENQIDSIKSDFEKFSNGLATPTKKINLNGKSTDHSDQTNTFLTLFNKQLKATPNAVALEFQGKSLSYKQLNERSNQLANYLISKDIKAEDKIVFCLSRSMEMIIGMIAVFKSGGAYIPIDPTYPQDRIDYIVEDSAAKLVLTEAAFSPLFNQNKTVLTIQVDDKAIGQSSNEAPSTKPKSTDLAYIIYTSGSSGKPKGVMVPHNNLAVFLGNCAALFDFDQSTKFPLLTSNAFDIFFFESLYPLTKGATILMLDNEDIREMDKLTQQLKTVTSFHMVPAFMRQLLNHISSTNTKEEYQGIKDIFIGGDLVPTSVLHDMTSVFQNARIHVLYGPTESTVFVSTNSYEVNADKEFMKGAIIGKPNNHTELYLLDNHERLCSLGIVGEICVSGPIVARAYLNQPELTKEKFIDNPFNPGETLYKTGDLGKWLDDGSIEFIGRKDDQVKIKGYRIELGEIEYVLQQQDYVDAAVVLVKTTATGDKELVAYVASKEEQNTSDIRKLLALSLPGYMIPNHFVQLEELPLNANGKIDKKQLPDPDQLGMAIGSEYVAPRNEIETILIQVFEQVLNKEKIGVKDNFFTLGGDSIKSIQTISRLKQIGYSYTLQDIMKYPIIEDLAERVKRLTRIVDQGLVSGPVPLGPVQLHFLQSNTKNKHHFNRSILLESKQPIAEEALRAVFDKIVLHHDALRMTFKQDGENWQQVNQNENTSYGFEVIEFVDEAHFDETCNRIQASINLETGPLFKVVLFKNKPTDRLLLIAHHLIIDGISWRLLLEDLSSLYLQYVQGEKLSLPFKTDSFKFWQEQLAEYAKSETLIEELDYWNTIEAVEMTSLPIGLDKTANNTYENLETIDFSLTKEQTELMLTKVHEAYKTDTNDLLITTMGMAIREVFGLEKILIRMEGHGREDIGLDVDVTRTLGWFTTVFPVLLDMSETDDIAQLINVKETLHRIPNKGIGYGVLRYLSGYNYIKEPEIVFNYLGDFGSNNSKDNEGLFFFSDEHKGIENDLQSERETILEVTGLVADNQFLMKLSYNNKQLSKTVMERFLKTYEQKLDQMIQKLASEENEYLTPVDLTYQGLSLEQLNKLNESL